MPPEEYWDTSGHGKVEPAEETGQYGVEVDKKAVLEALLLVSPEPLSVAGLSELTGFEIGAVREIMNELQLFYDERCGGLVIREVAGGFCFYSSPDAAPYVARLISSQVNPRLTRAALETLAIVAYLQPVSRGVIAEIRGVQSEGVIKTLEDRGLVQAVGRGGPPGYPNLYGTTTRFLERFGLNSLDDLPDLEQFAPDDETVDKIKRSLSWEISEEDVSAGSGNARKDPEDTVEGGDSFTPGGGEVDP
ncbi:MAG: SMC-Scp complex subunit ScpB [Actinobacteria bacterium]|nr:SMC-Scp complex subunit ScpB [Actinomycetota bacterium]